ncbi:hypothetical protein TRFO_35334 [Tritrichomonas foetus]|uniref:Peptidase C1A papain C-terminal domain-containing protein n=1 Tax=Tritrichomonas foetus TaxID=1144522 RepID=A0A1J4JGI8_9EUKA|nr:hypothetical protein TRFO_35334 [Tritrichomonas foetus]|eukprot:OHS98272.1 hypothetical protein TRFO_35334 [Tritrichomonas foetus]
MFLFLVSLCICRANDQKPLITQGLVDKINNNPNSTFKAKLYPQFAQMTIGEAKRFLSPVRKTPINHGSAHPVGANERLFDIYDKRVFAGLTNPDYSDQFDSSNKYKYQVYNNIDFCSSWASSVTSAMSLALSIHTRKFINLSIQFILDCDLMGDPCIERPPLNAYEQFWKRFIPQAERWDQPELKDGKPHFLRAPPNELTKETCDSQSSTQCYPGWTNCPRNRVLSGSCDATSESNCPIYFLYNWRWIKSHIWEVGPVTSSILVRPAFFTYSSGVYSSLGERASTGDVSDEEDENVFNSEILGMLDVTIIGWGQVAINLSTKATLHQQLRTRWWYVVPHFGYEWGCTCSEVFGVPKKLGDSGNVPHNYANDDTSDQETSEYSDLTSIVDRCASGSSSTLTGIVRFNRRFDDSNIESQAVGAVPFNFRPKAYRTPQATWSGYHAAEVEKDAAGAKKL